MEGLKTTQVLWLFLIRKTLTTEYIDDEWCGCCCEWKKERLKKKEIGYIYIYISVYLF